MSTEECSTGQDLTVSLTTITTIVTDIEIKENFFYNCKYVHIQCYSNKEILWFGKWVEQTTQQMLFFNTDWISN
jgi:hypothetical protein